ncbi:MAG: hypothetical protein D6736_04950, partial [Nitrospinota bacterium]
MFTRYRREGKQVKMRKACGFHQNRKEENMKRLFWITVLALGILSVGWSGAFAGTACLDAVTACNDIKILFKGTGDPKILTLNGWEYGCNRTDRMIYGTMRVEGNTASINYTKSGLLGSGGNFDATYVAIIDLTTNSGPYTFTQTGGGATGGSGTYNVIACPPSASSADRFV